MSILYLVEFSTTDIVIAVLYGLLSLIIGIAIGYSINSKYKKQIVEFERENVKLTSSVSNLESQYEEEKKARTNADDEIVLLRNRVRDRDVRIRETEGKMALISKRLEENEVKISEISAENELNLIELKKAKAASLVVKSKSEIKNVTKPEALSSPVKEKKSKKAKKAGRPASSKSKKTTKDSSSSEGKKRGRPAGSKNKATTVASSTIELKSSDKKKPGRPAGSKNKKDSTSKDVKKATAKRGRPKSIKTVEATIAPPKKRGRPAGSKNKATSTVKPVVSKRKPGRPAGSTTKATTPVKNEAKAPKKKVTPTTTRRRGRPAGSKNKATESTKGRGRKKDNLTLIEGIGPKMEDALRNAGIRTFAKIAATKPEKLKSVLVKANTRFGIAATDSWPTQAKFAVKGAFEELKAYQDTLNRGR